MLHFNVSLQVIAKKEAPELSFGQLFDAVE